MRRVLHVPACDLREGDVCSFNSYIPTEFLDDGWEDKSEHRELTLVTVQYDGSDWTIYLKFEDVKGNDFSLFTDPCTQYTLLQEL